MARAPFVGACVACFACAASIVSIAGIAGIAVTGCGDPVHDDLISSLGPEDPKVPQGPLHRPGQPCLACHGGRGPAQAQFSMAGTVFNDPVKTTGQSGVTVTLTDSDMKVFAPVTNAAGNFLVHADEYTPHYPVHVSLSINQTTQAMTSHVGRDGSCASCHHDPVGTESPGHVYIQP